MFLGLRDSAIYHTLFYNIYNFVSMILRSIYHVIYLSYLDNIGYLFQKDIYNPLIFFICFMLIFLVHIKQASLSRAHNVLTIVDDYIRATSTFLLPNKCNTI